MNATDRPIPMTAERLSAGLHELAAAPAPDYRDDILRQVARTRQRPRWAFIERWLPVAIITRPAAAPPMRAAWVLVAAALLAVALIVGTIVAGSRLLDPLRSDRGPNGLLAVPAVELASTWDPTSVDGLSMPLGMDVGPDGNLYLINGGTSEVLVLAPDGRVVRRFGGPGSGDGQFLFQQHGDDPFSSIGGVAVAADGTTYVADTVNDRVQAFAPDGTFLRSWGGYGADDGHFLDPIDVAAGPDGSVFVVDDQRDDVQRFDAAGAYLQTVGRHGRGLGELFNTGFIDADTAGRLLDADFGDQRVQAWDADAAPLWSFDGGSDALSDPLDAAWGRDGTFYVTDASGLVVARDGDSRTSRWTPPGMTSDWFGYVTAADDGTVYVSSPRTDEIHRLSPTVAELADASPSAAVPSVSPSVAASPVASGAPTAGGPTEVVVADTFTVPFRLTLPTTTDQAAATPGWHETTREPGVVDFQYVRDADRWPAYVTVYRPASVIADPCHPGNVPHRVEQPATVDQLVAGLTSLVGFRAGPVENVTIGGLPGKAVDLETNLDISACDGDPWLHPWTYFMTATDTLVKPAESLSSSHQRVIVLDVDGTPVLITAWDLGAWPDEIRQMDEIVDSIRFD